MQIEVIRKEPTFKVELNFDEFEFLFRLLGNHVVGEGKFRQVSNNIFEALDTCNNMYVLGVPKDNLQTQTGCYIRLTQGE